MKNTISDKATFRDFAAPFVCVLLLFSGFFKGSLELEWLLIDLTVLAAGLVLVGVFGVFARQGLQFVIDPRVLLFFAAFVPAWFYVTPNGYTMSKLGGMVITLVAMLGSFYLVNTERRQKIWVTFFVAGGAMVLLGTLFAPNESVAVGRLALEGSNTIAAGRATGVALVIVFTVAMMVKGWSRLWLFVAAGIFAGGMIATGSRGPILAAAVAIVIVAIFSKSRGAFSRVVLVGIALAGGWFYIADNSGAGAGRIEAVLSGEQSGTESRSLIWGAAMRALTNFPEAVAGVGWSEFKTLLRSGESLSSGDRQYPHNIILEAFVEGGWWAGAATVLFIALALLRLIRNNHTTLTAAVLAMSVFFVVNAMVSGDINDNRMMWATLAVAWVVVPVARKQRGHNLVSDAVIGQNDTYGIDRSFQRGNIRRR